MLLVLQSGFSSSKIVLKQDKSPKQQGAVNYKIHIHAGFFYNLNIHSQIYFTLITLKNVNIPIESSLISI